jgi:hypothetical protein
VIVEPTARSAALATRPGSSVHRLEADPLAEILDAALEAADSEHLAASPDER